MVIVVPTPHVGDGVVGEVAEHAVEQTRAAAHHDVRLQAVAELHLLLLQLQCRLLLYVRHNVRDVHVLLAHHLRCVVHAVERRDVLQQRGEALALRVAALQKLLACGIVDVRVLEDGLQIALYACHGCLQLVRDVLRELSFQYVLLAACSLQSLVHLDDAFGYLAQLVVGEHGEVLRVERLVVVGS